MLAKLYRLPAGIRLPQQGAIRQTSFTVRIQRNNLPQSRFGFLVSKKVSKKAVERNKVRRRLQSCVQEHLIPLLHGYDVFVLAQPASKEQTRASLCEQLLAALSQKGLLHENSSNRPH